MPGMRATALVCLTRSRLTRGGDRIGQRGQSRRRGTVERGRRIEESLEGAAANRLRARAVQPPGRIQLIADRPDQLGWAERLCV